MDTTPEVDRRERDWGSYDVGWGVTRRHRSLTSEDPVREVGSPKEMGRTDWVPTHFGYPGTIHRWDYPRGFVRGLHGRGGSTKSGEGLTDVHPCPVVTDWCQTETGTTSPWRPGRTTRGPPKIPRSPSYQRSGAVGAPGQGPGRS